MALPGVVKVLLVEPWLAGSHQAWADGYAAASVHQVRVVGLPGRHWQWRLAGSAPVLASQIEAQLRAGFRPDVLLVSGLTDVAQLLGLVRSILSRSIPVVVYQHESQLLYPTSGDRPAGRGPALTNWLSWLAADAVFFNSEYHRSALVAALPGFLAALPDETHHELLPTVVDRFEVVPLGIDLAWTDVERPGRRAWPVIVWPHRWEQDKDPLAFGRALDRLVAAGLDHRVVLAGSLPSVQTGLRDQTMERHGARVLADGPFAVDDYRRQLLEADIVVSCAHHDFFGVAVVEAVAAGCTPVVPATLAYPETLGPGLNGYQVGSFGSALEEAVRCWHEAAEVENLSGTHLLRTFVREHGWDRRAELYDQRLAALVAAHQ